MLKKMMAVAMGAALALTVTACSTDQLTTPTTQIKAQATLGNGYPVPGFDYQMQIIGVPKGKSAPMDDNNGHRIFVLLNGGGEVTNPGGVNNQLKTSNVNKIYLCNSTNSENVGTYVNDARCQAFRSSSPDGFGVIDANATDSNGAMFGIPDPCTGQSSLDGCTPRYAIWARALAGKGSATITTCADETGTGFDLSDDIWCGSNGITLSKMNNFKATEVSDNLLYMTLTVDATNQGLLNCINGTVGQTYSSWTGNVYLFDRCFENYFWNYDNHGLKNLQLRFYFASTLG